MPTVSESFLGVASGYDKIVVMAHNNPDPDAIASGWSIVHLVREKLGKPAMLVAGGEIVRAENKKMVKLLQPPLTLVKEIVPDRKTLLVLVDCDVRTTNHPPLDPARQPIAVIDHHTTTSGAEPPPEEAVYRDLRADVLSTAAIAASYLKEQRVEPPVNLATALVYAIRTETKAGETHYSVLDREILSWATERANPSHVAQIEDATLALPYFAELALAIESTTLYNDTAVCILPQCRGAEAVGEIADLLLRCEGVHNVLCAATFQKDLVVSVRSDGTDRNAAHDVVALLAGIGHGGGHPHRAGGIIQGVAEDKAKVDELYKELRWRWREICHVGDQPEKRLVSKTSILKTL